MKGCEPTIWDSDSSLSPLSFSKTETRWRKKCDTPVIELSLNQLLETHLGTSAVVPPTQSRAYPEG